MNDSLAYVMYRFLRQLKISVSYNYLEEKVTSHPDYPSLLSITETLEGLGIYYEACEVPRDKFQEIPTPFIIYARENSIGSFHLVSRADKFQRKHPNTFKKWNGIVLAAEKPAILLNEENEKRLQDEKRTRIQITVTALSVLLLSLLSLSGSFSVSGLLYMVASLAGISIAILIVQQELGIVSSFAEQLCGIHKKTDCNAVIHSKASNLPFHLNWSDVGIVYFLSTWLCFVLALVMKQDLVFKSILSCIALMTLPFTIFSLYYQWRVVRKWCMLCLLTLTVLWAQFFLLFPQLSALQPAQSYLYFVGIVASIFFLITSCWTLVLKPLLLQKRTLMDNASSLTRFKRSPDIFFPMLERNKLTDDANFKYGLQIGDPDAIIQLQVACAPFCGPCELSHKKIHDLLEKNKRGFGVTIWFAVNPGFVDERSRQVVEYIFRHLAAATFNSVQEKHEYYRRVLHDWFTLKDLAQFQRKYSNPSPINVDAILAHHENWITRNNIKFTPTVFVNRYLLPRPYTIEDVLLLSDMIRQKYSDAVNIENPGALRFSS